MPASLHAAEKDFLTSVYRVPVSGFVKTYLALPTCCLSSNKAGVRRQLVLDRDHTLILTNLLSLRGSVTSGQENLLLLQPPTNTFQI